MNIFRLFQRWVEKARDNTTRGSDVPSSAPPTLTAASEETVYERNETAEDVPYQAEVDLVGRASVVWSDAIRWIAPGSTAVVAGRSVGGMVYLGPGQGRVIWEQTSRPVIDPSLPVAEVGNEFSGESMPYWPSYSGIAASAGFPHQCTSSPCLCEFPTHSPSLEWTTHGAWPTVSRAARRCTTAAEESCTTGTMRKD